MGRRDMSNIRRAEYSAAAYRALMRHGNQGTSLTRVAEEAGASKANILHYFKNKEALIAAALRHANSVLLREAVLLLKEARTPWERIYAVVETNLSPTSFRPEVAHAWISLCAGVPHVAAYQRIQTVIYARMRSNLTEIPMPKTWLIRALHAEGLSVGQICRALKTSSTNVKRTLREAGGDKPSADPDQLSLF